MKIIISLFLGILISIILSKFWINKNIIYRAPDSAKVRENIYINDDKLVDENCYKLEPRAVIGPIIYRAPKK